jgi:hypothetical protein
MVFLLFLLDDRRIRIREAQKHMDPTDPDPQHCFFYVAVKVHRYWSEKFYVFIIVCNWSKIWIACHWPKMFHLAVRVCYWSKMSHLAVRACHWSKISHLAMRACHWSTPSVAVVARPGRPTAVMSVGSQSTACIRFLSSILVSISTVLDIFVCLNRCWVAVTFTVYLGAQAINWSIIAVFRSSFCDHVPYSCG